MPRDLLVYEIAYRDPLATFEAFVGQPYALFLDSARVDERLGRYTFIAIDPFLKMTSKNGRILVDAEARQGDPFDVLQGLLTQFPLKKQAGLPPFQTGAAGFFAYDLGRHLETLPPPRSDDMGFPDLMLGFYDLMLAFDHATQKAWVFSSGYPEQDAEARNRRAEGRMRWLLSALEDAPEQVVQESIPQATVEICSNFTPNEYRAAVQRVIDYIHAGDIFQANLSQRFQAELAAGDTPWNLYKRLRRINPAPFVAYFQDGDVVIASASPERFLLLQDGQVETRPIKGTRPRGGTPEADRALADELLHSEKDRAENVMIVDLLRNDLSRVCRDHTVLTPEICVLEQFATVYHLVSTVTGQLKPGQDAVDLLRATFPGGSITGAPKIRAMEIINELEPTSRGPYCGSVGYIAFNGDIDTSIVIRTYAVRGRQVTFQAGGGIVADSDPEKEYCETLDKARALLSALGSHYDPAD